MLHFRRGSSVVVVVVVEVVVGGLVVEVVEQGVVDIEVTATDVAVFVLVKKADDGNSHSAPKYAANSHLMETSMKLLVKRDTKVVVKTSITEMFEGNICLLFLPLLLLTFCEYDAVQEEGQKTL